MISEPHQRLQKARKEAGYDDATAAADAMGISPPTYLGHENGSRGLSRSAKRYAEFFHVSLEWLLTGRGAPRRSKPAPADEPRTVPLVGYVGAGAQTHFFQQDAPLDEVPAPDHASEATVAVEIRGESLGTFFDRWLVFYDNVHRPVDAALVGRLCVVGLRDGRILIKKIQRSRSRGLFHLLSQTEPPILDVEVDWAAPVKHMVPQ
ncbi:MAG: XRE family transcriptional regulator [Pseudomonadota bacterium]